MSTEKSAQRTLMFSNEAIRLFIGVITFTLPIIVVVIPCSPLTSISAAYYTNARDIFVGVLFVLGAFLIVYKGHSKSEDWIATLGGIAAIIAALCPTKCDLCQANASAYIHAIAGNAVFGVTAYFCLGPFRKSAQGKQWCKAKRREKFYTICGCTIIACAVILIVIGLFVPAEQRKNWTPIFWGESVMLWVFSAAWVVAAKLIPWFTDKEKDERFAFSREYQIYP
jgi:hypothetical protein